MAELHTLDGVEVVAVPPEFALYPYGVFTTFVAAGGGVLGFGDHLARLAHGALELWGHALDLARVRTAVAAHVALLSGETTVRVTLYPSSLPLARPVEAVGCRVLVSSRPLVGAGDGEFAVQRVEFSRELAAVKSTGLTAQLWLRREAQLAGFDDVLFCRGDQVLEGATWSLLVWRSGVVSSPVVGVLPSITVAHLEGVARGLGWRVERRAVSVDELREAELVLAVNATWPARAVTRLDGGVLAVDPVLLEQVLAGYAELARERV